MSFTYFYDSTRTNIPFINYRFIKNYAVNIDLLAQNAYKPFYTWILTKHLFFIYTA